MNPQIMRSETLRILAGPGDTCRRGALSSFPAYPRHAGDRPLLLARQTQPLSGIDPSDHFIPDTYVNSSYTCASHITRPSVRCWSRPDSTRSAQPLLHP
ncbi:hypothetical protein B0T12DRAFT_40774 [Alternaria alternata]|nr:hypothetical protein B0T12DRAFT_40774 [Alternaria alternata]